MSPPGLSSGGSQGRSWRPLGESWRTRVADIVEQSLPALRKPCWGRLGAVLAPSRGRLGSLLGQPWGFFKPSWGLLGPSRSPFGVTLSTSSRENRILPHVQKPQYVLHFWAPGGPRKARDGPKLGSSWHLEAISKRSWRHLAISACLVAVILPSRAALEPSWARLGADRAPLLGVRGGAPGALPPRVPREPLAV